jgi:hypothetical protein
MPWPLSGSGMGPYVALYVMTLALHAALIGYVLAGTGYAAVAAIRKRPDPIAEAARDWLPFFLGAAITAGVAPLLFVQMLYQERFYTADLLAGPRWLAIVPALVVGFYALYVHKATERGRRRAAAIAIAAACFGFVAWSWTEHHLLMNDDARWHAFYAAGERFHVTSALVPRLATWIFAALPIFAVIAAWQLGAEDGARRRLAIVALVGILGSTALALVVRGSLDPAARAGVEAARPWLVVLIAGRVFEAGAWIAILLRPPRRGALMLATGAAAGSVVAGACLREAARLHLVAPIRPNAASAGGAVVFVVALAAVIGAIVLIARLVRRAPDVTPPAPEPPSPSPSEPAPEPPPRD